MNNIEIQVGQVWSDCSLPERWRFVLVEAVTETNALCRTLKPGRKTAIRKNRMKPGSRGYSLVINPRLLNQIRDDYGLHFQGPASHNNMATTDDTEDCGFRISNNQLNTSMMNIDSNQVFDRRNGAMAEVIDAAKVG